MAVEVIPVLYRQVGWRPCVACSDAHKLSFGAFRGRMWLGEAADGSDLWCECPVCAGEGRVPRYQTLDARTGAEIDYEALGRDRDGNPVPVKIVPVTGPV